jgi:hypothetical protein
LVLIKISIPLINFLRRKINMAQPLPVLEEPLDLAELSACDRCRAPGKFMVVFTSGLDLVFCGHHGREYAHDVHGVAEVLDMAPAI